MFLGMARGKVGDTVFYRQSGQQIARAYNPSPKNPKSLAQAYQRMCFATVSSARAALAAIVDHSWQGVTYGTASLSEFTKRNIALMRAAAFAQGDTVNDYNIKGAQTIVRNQYVVSSGSLSMVPYTGQAFGTAPNLLGGVTVQNVETADLAENIGSPEDYRARLALIGLAPGDQLTILAISHDTSVEVAAYGANAEAVNYGGSVAVARVVFRKESEISFETPFSLLEENQQENYGTFNTAVITRQDGGPIQLRSVSTHTAILIPVMGNVVDGGAAIRSAQDINGKWLRSNARIALVSNIQVNARAIDVVPSYMQVQSSNLGSPRYLNNALTPETGTISESTPVGMPSGMCIMTGSPLTPRPGVEPYISQFQVQASTVPVMVGVPKSSITAARLMQYYTVEIDGEATELREWEQGEEFGNEDYYVARIYTTAPGANVDVIVTNTADDSVWNITIIPQST